MLPSYPCQAGTTISLPSLSSLSTVSNSFNCEEVNSEGCANRPGGHHIRDVSTTTTPTSCHLLSPEVCPVPEQGKDLGGSCSSPSVMCVSIGRLLCVCCCGHKGYSALFSFFPSEDRQELAMSPEPGVDEAHWAQISGHRVPGPGHGRETGKVARDTPAMGVDGIVPVRPAQQ